MSLDVNIEPEEFNTSELHKCIEDVAKIKGLDEFEYQVEFACEKSESFVANIFRVLIKENGQPNIVSVILKTLINTARRELFKDLHKREVFVYNEVITKFKDILQEIVPKNRIELPECIYSSTEKDKEVIVLEDLSVKGFVLDNKLSKFEKLDYLQVRLVISELAKFHALSFILEKRNPDGFSDLASQMHDILFQDNFLNKSKLRSYFIDSFTTAVKAVAEEEVRNKLIKVGPKLLQILQKYVQPKKYNVLCHGDCWINNIMFKHEEKSQSQICILDFQAMRYANPTLDIVYFLYLCTDSEFRLEHFKSLKNVYYDSLNQFLKLYNYEIDEIYPKEDYVNDLKESLPFGFLMALIEMRIVTTQTESETSLKTYPSLLCLNENEQELDCSDGSERLFQIRINDVVKESVENGVLDKLFNDIKCRK